MTTQRSLNDLVNRATATLIAKTGQNNPAIQAIAACIAGISYGNYAYQDQLFRELHPETCSESWLYLHAARHETPRNLPTFARGFVLFEQLDGVVDIPKGVKLSFSSLEFEVIEKGQSDQPVEVVALQMGSESNLPSGAVLKLEKALSGVNPNNVVSQGIGGGTDIEDLEHWRERVITAFNKDSIVGRAEDYELWAKSAHSDVDFAWCLDNTPDIGQLEIYVGTHADDPTVSQAVLDACDALFYEKKLAGCFPVAKVPTHVPLNMEIQGVEDETVRANIISELKAFIISKMGQYNRPLHQMAPISPTELILVINKVTSQFILKQPSDEQRINPDQIFTLGAITWS